MWRQPVWYQSVRRQAVWCQCVCVCVWNICKDVKLHLWSLEDFEFFPFWDLYTSFELYTAPPTSFWIFTWWFKLRKTLCSVLRYILFKTINFHRFSTSRRGTWRAIRDHVQRSYLIVREAEPDQLCVPAPFFNCWTSCYNSLLRIQSNLIFRWFQEGLRRPLLRISVNQLSNQLRCSVVHSTAAI